MLARRGFSRCSNLHSDQHRGGPDLSRENPRIGERAGTAAQLGIVHVLSHSRHRQYVVTVTIVARVSTALPWQKGQMAGRAQPSAERESGIVIVSSATRVERGEFDGVSEQEGDRQQHSQVPVLQDAALCGASGLTRSACTLSGQDDSIRKDPCW